MLTGYSDRLSVRPADTIRFMISTDAPRYRVDLVRLIHGDSDPRGPGRKVQPVASDIAGEYFGVVQPLNFGSYIRVPGCPGLGESGQLTLFLWIWPTLIGQSRQVILSNRDAAGNGFSLAVGANGRLEISAGSTRFESRARVLERRWQWVSVSLSEDSPKLQLMRGGRGVDLDTFDHPSETYQMPQPAGSSQADIYIAAEASTEGVGCVFNGKIARPALFSRKLSLNEIESLTRPDFRAASLDGCVAAWDFSREIQSDSIFDENGNNCHCHVVQRPVRAMTGPHWTGHTIDFRLDPSQYDAIHFHEDSLVDAQWSPGFQYTVPDDLPSGIYAATVRTERDTLDLPFFVGPPKSRRTADTAFVLPTFTYLAYGNELYRDYGLNSVYDRYVDGASVPFGPTQVPKFSLQPDRGAWRSPSGDRFGRHLCSDLYFVDWMDAMGQRCDIVTDHDLHCEGAVALANYRVVVTGSHPEYVSGRILDAYEGHLRAGGSLIYMGGNGFYGVTTLSDDGQVIEVRRPNGSRPSSSEPGEGNHEMTGEPGGLWRFRGRTPQSLTGVGFTAQGWRADGACGWGRPYEVREGLDETVAKTFFDGVDLSASIGDFESLTLGAGAASDEIDRADIALGTPHNAVILATASGFSGDYQHVIEERVEVNDASTLPGNPNVRADIAYFLTPQGGAVFSVGSIGWFSCLSFNDYDNSVSRLTRNVLLTFLKV